MKSQCVTPNPSKNKKTRGLLSGDNAGGGGEEELFFVVCKPVVSVELFFLKHLKHAVSTCGPGYPILSP